MSKTKSDLPAPTYNERMTAKDRTNQDACIARINRLQAEIDANGKLIGKTMVAAVNAMREQGLALQALCGREQLAFDFFLPLQTRLKLDFKECNQRIAILKRMPEPAGTPEEAAAIFKEVFQQLHLLQITEGDGNPGRPSDPYTLFLNGLSLFKQKWQKTQHVVPLESLSDARLKDFLSDTEWLAEERTRATALLQGRN